MELDPMNPTWQRLGETQLRAEADVVARARDRARQLELLVRVRDRYETLIGLALLPVFLLLAWYTPYPLSRAGAVIIAICCVLIPLRLRAARRPPPSPAQDFTTVVRMERERVQAQCELLRSVAWWYFGPLLVGVSLFMIGPLSAWPAVLAVTAATAFMVWLWAQNQRVIRLELDPWDRELQRILDDSEGPGGGAP